MKKILILQNSIPHYRIPLYEMLAESYNITVLHSGEAATQPASKYKEIIVPVRKVGPFFWQSNVFNVVNSDEYDVIIAMFDIRWIQNVLAVFKKRKSTLIYWGHRYSKSFFINIIRTFFLKKSDRILLYSNIETDKLISSGIQKSKIFVANNTIEVENHSDGSSSQKSSFIFVGRAQKRKKVEIFLRAFADVVAHIPNNIIINIIGSGDENIELKKLSKELNISDRVFFRGSITDPEKLKALFQNAYAYISPGPVGLGVLHSFSYGVPVVTNIVGKHGPEFSNIINNVNSLLYETFNELTGIIIKISNDKNFASALGEKAYQQYSQERTLQNMVDGFHKAIHFDG